LGSGAQALQAEYRQFLVSDREQGASGQYERDHGMVRFVLPVEEEIRMQSIPL